ncbi:hypothetical protein H2201_008908, partial [Coniosporium apollinis]
RYRQDSTLDAIEPDMPDGLIDQVASISQLVSSLMQEVQALKASSEDLRSSNMELKASNVELKASNNELRHMIEGLVKTTSSQPRSYATVAASSPSLLSPVIAVTPPDSMPDLRSVTNPGSGGSRTNSKRDSARAKHQTATVYLNLSDTKLGEGNAQDLVKKMNDALRAADATKDYTCTAVQIGRQGNTGFIFQSEQQAQTVQKEQPWTKVAEDNFNQARPRALEKFKVKATNVNKHLVGNPGKGEKVAPEIVQEIAKENNIAIQSLRMLSHPSDSDRIQLVVICPDLAAKEDLLDRGMVSIHGEAAWIMEFYESKPTRQCFRCWSFNHNAADCSSPYVCAQCGIAGHKERECQDTPHCANCKGSHSATDKKCPHKERMLQPVNNGW